MQQKDARDTLSEVRQALDQLEATLPAEHANGVLSMALIEPMFSLVSAVEPADVVRTVVTTAARGLQGSAGALCLLTDGDALTVEGIWDRGRTWLGHDPGSDSQLLDDIAARPLSDALRLPLRLQGVESGEIRVWNLTPEGENAVRLLALLAGMALGGLTLKQRVNQRLVRDPLTGLYNLRYFEDTLARELHRAQRLRSNVSVLLVDLDDFTTFNRRFGNDYGDRMLQAVGGALQASFRGSDACCRMHGQRFAVLLPDAEIGDAERRAKELVKLIGEVRIDRRRNILPRITASVGIVGYPIHAVDAPTLLDGAEAALLLAKQAGPASVRVAQREE